MVKWYWWGIQQRENWLKVSVNIQVHLLQEQEVELDDDKKEGEGDENIMQLLGKLMTLLDSSFSISVFIDLLIENSLI